MGGGLNGGWVTSRAATAAIAKGRVHAFLLAECTGFDWAALKPGVWLVLLLVAHAFWGGGQTESTREGVHVNRMRAAS